SAGAGNLPRRTGQDQLSAGDSFAEPGAGEPRRISWNVRTTKHRAIFPATLSGRSGRFSGATCGAHRGFVWTTHVFDARGLFRDPRWGICSHTEPIISTDPQMPAAPAPATSTGKPAGRIRQKNEKAI